MSAFKRGQRVEITQVHSKYYGCHCTVARDSRRSGGYNYERVDIYVDGVSLYQPRSYNEVDLVHTLSLYVKSVTLIEEAESQEETVMFDELVAVKGLGIHTEKIAQVQFKGIDKRYAYNLHDTYCEVGYKVMVTGEMRNHVGTVVDIVEDLTFAPTQDVYAVIHDGPYLKAKQAQESKKALAQKLEQRMKESEKDLMYQMFAEKDPEFAKIYAEYKAIQ